MSERHPVPSPDIGCPDVIDPGTRCRRTTERDLVPTSDDGNRGAASTEHRRQIDGRCAGTDNQDLFACRPSRNIILVGYLRRVREQSRRTLRQRRRDIAVIGNSRGDDDTSRPDLFAIVKYQTVTIRVTFERRNLARIEIGKEATLKLEPILYECFKRHRQADVLVGKVTLSAIVLQCESAGWIVQARRETIGLQFHSRVASQFARNALVGRRSSIDPTCCQMGSNRIGRMAPNR